MQDIREPRQEAEKRFSKVDSLANRPGLTGGHGITLELSQRRMKVVSERALEAEQPRQEVSDALQLADALLRELCAGLGPGPSVALGDP